MRSLTKLALIAFLCLLAFGTSTAYACGCGIYIPRDGDANVSQERALIRWDGQRQDIVLSLGVLGGSKEAAIILPVPAQADVKLADVKLFDELAEMTKPLEREEIEWTLFPSLGSSALPPEGAVGGAPPVNVLSRQTIGPFDVANLAATDTDALKTWLDENGFQLDAQVITLMQPYVQENWTFVAVRMSSDESSAQLSGNLQPLWISFDSPQLIYPMRASAHAANPQTLNLYILADHRIAKANAFGASRVSYTDWLEPTSLPSGSAITPFASRKFFLTKFIDTVNPAQVDDDFSFSTAPQDTTVREVIVHRVQRDISGLLLLACFGIVALSVIGFVVLLFLIARRRRALSAV